MKYIGSLGEHATLAELLKRGMEAYLAISKNQENYDITVIVNPSKVVRLQVKATELQNNSTNNSINGTDKVYDFLILVVIDNGNETFYILPKDQVSKIRGDSVDLSVSQKNGNSYCVKDCFNCFEDDWKVIEQ